MGVFVGMFFWVFGGMLVGVAGFVSVLVGVSVLVRVIGRFGLVGAGVIFLG